MTHIPDSVCEKPVLRGATFKSRGRLAGLVILPAVAYACFSRPQVEPGGWADLGLNILAWALLSLGIFMRIWSTLYIGGRKSVVLVTEGPYALCRHPLYVGSFLIVAALAVFLKSPFVLAAVAATALIYSIWILPTEEQFAVACFGADYLQYRAATPRILPAFRRLRRLGFVEVKIGELLRELARDFGCVMIGASAELFAHLRIAPWWPHLPGWS